MVMLLESKKRTLIISLYVIGGVLLIYILPFFIHDTSIFSQGYDYHTKAAIGEWMRGSNKPLHLYRGIGFAAYFYEYLSGDISSKIDVLRFVHLSITLMSTVLMSIIYYIYRQKINKKLYLLASLKIYLVIFYSFIQIPYHYLFLVPLFIYILIFFEFMNLNFTSNDKPIISK